MKPQYKLSSRMGVTWVFLLSLCLAPFGLTAQITNIPDQNFEQTLIDLGIDSDNTVNGQVLTSDVETITTLIIKYKNISDLTGIEDFAALQNLDITGNQLTLLQISENLELKTLICNVNPLDSIDLSQNVLLENLELQVVHTLDNIGLSNNTSLNTLRLDDCWIDSIDVSNNINLKTLYAGGSGITEIDLSNNPILEYLDVAGVHLSTLNVSNNTLLKELYCGNYDGDMGQVITEIDLSNNVNLEILEAENLFTLQRLNAKNGNNSILSVILPCMFEGYPCELTELQCVQVDDEVAATNGDFPYNTWFIEADFIFSEDCALGLPSVTNKVFSLNQNPVREQLVLISPTATGYTNLQIYTIQGKLLSAQNILFEKHASIDVSQLSAGLYFLKIKSDNGNIETIEFMRE